MTESTNIFLINAYTFIHTYYIAHGTTDVAPQKWAHTFIFLFLLHRQTLTVHTCNVSD